MNEPRRSVYDYSTFGDDTRRGRAAEGIADFVNARTEEANRQRAQRAGQALEQVRLSGISVDQAARASALSSSILGPRADGFSIYNSDILDSFEAEQARRREEGLLSQFSRTAEYMSDPRNAALLQEDVEFISNMEELLYSVGRRGETIYQNTPRVVEDRVLNTARLIAGDSQRTLQDIFEDQQQRNMDMIAEREAPTRGPEAVRARRGGGYAEDGEPTPATRLQSGVQAMFRYLNSRPAAIFGGEGDAEQVFEFATEGMEENLIEGVVDAANIARRWPTGNNRREIEMALADAENTPGGAVAAFANLVADRPLDMLMYMSTIGAESGLSAVAALGVGAVTRSPAATIATIGIGSGVQSAALYPQEIAQSRGYDFSTPEGRAAFLRDPRTVRDFQDDVFAYSATIAIFDAASGGIAGRTLANSRIGNIILQGAAQGFLGGTGEALGRIASGEEVNWTEVLLEAIAEVVTAPIETAGVVISNTRERMEQAQTARQRRTMFGVLAGLVDRSSLRGRNAREVARAVDFVARDGEVENVYINADRLDQLFQSGELGVDREGFFASLPDFDRTEFQRALENGGDIAIPIGQYAAHIAGTDPDAVLSGHLRFRAEELSFVEAQELQQQIADTITAAEDNMEQAVTALGETLRGDLAQEFQRVRQEIAQAQPDLTSTAVGKLATTVLKQATTLAQRSGMDPAQWMRQYGLPQFRAGDAVGAAAGTITATPSLVRAAAGAEASTTPIREVQIVLSALADRGVDVETATDREIQDVTDELRAAGALDLDLADRAVASIDDQSSEGETMMQTVTIRNGEESAADWGIDTSKMNKVRDIALALQKRQRKLYGKINRNQRGPATVRKMAEWLADEVEFELQDPTAAATGWYGPRFQSALDKVGRLVPALVDERAARRSKMPGVNTVEDARALATAIFAVSSNGTNVMKNVENAVRILQRLDETGKLDGKQKHQRATAINENTELMVRLAGEMGAANMQRDLALTGGLVSDLRKEAKTLPLAKDGISGYPADMFVPRASMYLGPKLAAFYANLSGADGYLTMDLWWTRTMRRYQGDVLPRVRGLKNEVDSKGNPIGLHRLKHLVGDPSLTDAEALNIATALANQYEKKGYKNGTEAEKAANTIHKDANLMLDEAPTGVAERRFFVEIAQEAQRILSERRDEYISIADIQALVWYYEKRLMVDMGAKDSLSISYDEAAESVIQRMLREDPEQMYQRTEEPAPAADDTIPGLEKASPGRVPGVRELATQYMRDRGLPVRHQAEYVKVDRERAERIAALYDEMADTPNDPEVRAAYEALAAETIAQYEALQQLGFTFEWITGEDPYATPADAIRDMQENKHLWVFPTDAGFGTLTEASEANPLLAMTDYVVDGRQARVNDLFRIVHDVFGHGSEGASFGPRGEENAWQAHVRMFSPLAARAMTTETRGQNSWVNYGPFGEQNRADPANTTYADQKVGLLPEWVSTEGIGPDRPTEDLELFQSFDAAYDPEMDFAPERIREMSDEEVLELFRRDDWAIVSTTDTVIGPWDHPDNVAAAQSFKTLLGLSDMPYYELTGVYGGVSDGPSFLLLGRDALNWATDAARDYMQESIVTREGLVYTDGSRRPPVPFNGVTRGHAARRKGDYSTFAHPTVAGGLPRDSFSLDLQWPSAQDLSMDDTGQKSHYGARVEDGWAIEMVHWSRSELTEIDPAKAGTGQLPGPERRRSGPKKSFFGINQHLASGYQRESSALGGWKHTVRVPARDMYPWNRDPDGLRAKIKPGLSEEAQIGAYEDLIKAAGYRGYFVIEGNLGDVAVMFEAVEPRSVEYVNDAALTKANAFTTWFNDGIVKNSDGTPRMVFHSSKTTMNFPAFRGLSHFGTRKAAADRAKAIADSGGTMAESAAGHRMGTRYFAAYLNMRNPLKLGSESTYPVGSYQTSVDVLRHAIMKGVLPRNAVRKIEAMLDDQDFFTYETEEFGLRASLAQLIRELETDPQNLFFLDDDLQREAALATAWDAVEAGYKQIAAIFREAGFDGMIYTNEVEDPGSTSYIILDPGDAKSPWNSGVWDANNADLLYQGDPSLQQAAPKPRASIILPKEPGAQAVVNVFENANLSSILHEMGHWQLWTLQKMAKDGNAFAQSQLDEIGAWWMQNAAAISKETEKYGALIDQAQVEEYLTVGTTGRGDVDKVIHTALHEQFARGWEAYLMEGKAPTHALRSIFESFTTWMLSIYRSVRNLDVQISDDIRAVYDRMLATEDEMVSAEERALINDEIANVAKDMGLDEEAYGRLVTLTNEAREEGRQKARADMLDAQRRIQSAEYKRRLAEIEAQEHDRIRKEPVQRAIQWLAYDKWIGDEDIPRGPDGRPMELRLDTAMLREDYPELDLNSLPRGRRPVYVKDTLLSADEVAGWFGFDSGFAMLEAMKTAPKFKDAVAAATRQRAEQELGDIMQSPDQIAQVVDDALHGDKHGQLIVAELRAINRIGGGKNRMTSRQQAKVIAQEVLGRRSVREAMQAGRFMAAERKHAEAAARLLAEGKVNEAFAEKRKQLIQHAMYVEARRIADLVGKSERLAGRLQKKGTRENLAGEYLGAIDDILESYDFRKISGKAENRRARLNAWLKMMREQNRMNEVAVPEAVLNEARRVPYKTLTPSRLQQVYESLQNIEHTARFKQKLRVAQQERELQEIRDDFKAAFDQNIKGKKKDWVPTKGEEMVRGVTRYLNVVRNADTILRRIDGWTQGTITQLLKRDIDEAAATAEGMREQAQERMQEIFDRFYTRGEQRRMNVRRTWEGIPHTLSKWDMISVVLNMGNAGNLQRLMSPDAEYRFTMGQLEAVKKTMEKRDFEFAQAIWDMLSQEYWPLIQKRERRLTGVPPEGVEPQELQTQYGSFRGGYYPISYDARFGSAAALDQQNELADEIMMGRQAKASTKNGFLNARAKGGGQRTVKLGIHVLFGHVNTVIHDLAYSEAVNNTWKLLRDKEIADTFRRNNMGEELEALETWVKEVAAGPVGGTHTLAGTFRFLKSGFTMSKLLFNMSTVAVQVTGIAQTAALLGTVDTARGYATYLGTSRGWQAMAGDVAAKSKFMQERQRTFHRDMYDLFTDVNTSPIMGKRKRFQRMAMAAGFWTMQKVQYYAVDLPTWIAAYEQARRKGESDQDASYYADRMVARAQASGLFSDRTMIERGTLGRDNRNNEFVRLFTALGSYMFAKYNVAEEVVGRTARDIRDPEKSTMIAVLKGASDMVLLFTVEALLYRMIRNELPGWGDDEEDEEDQQNWATFIAKETAYSVLSTMPFLRELPAVFEGFGGGGAYGGIAETAGGVVASLQDAMEGEANANDIRAVFDALGLAVPGFPSTAAWRAVKYSGGLEEEMDIRGMILGQPSAN